MCSPPDGRACDFRGTGGYALTMATVYLSACRACVGAHDPHCWRCEGKQVYGVETEAEADFVLRAEGVGLAISTSLAPTPRFLAWLVEVERSKPLPGDS